jgi:TonB family protein
MKTNLTKHLFGAATFVLATSAIAQEADKPVTLNTDGLPEYLKTRIEEKAQQGYGALRRYLEITGPIHNLRVSAVTASAAASITLAAAMPSGSPADAPGVKDLGRIHAARGYDTGVLRELARYARHPDQFQASPRRLNGKVDIEFVVNRDGSLGEAAITQSSRSNALDGAALRVVERARFLPLPADVQPDGLPRRYVVTFDYRYPAD